MKLSVPVACVLFFLSLSAVLAVPFPRAITQADIDFAASRIISCDSVAVVDEASLLDVLGLDAAVSGNTRPSFARVPRKDEETIRYLLVFKQPVALGTVLGGTGELWVLKPGAALPPNADNVADWTSVAVQPNQSSPRFAPLPPGTLTRALIVSAVAPRSGSPYLRLLTPRLANHTPLAVANADTEFTSEPYLSPPYTYDAGHITRGAGTWINSGKKANGINPRAPITDVAPSWFVLSWSEPRRIEGVVLQDNFEKFDLQVFDGPPGINATAATEQEWKTIRKPVQTLIDGQRWLTFEPMKTRALRLRLTKTKDGPVAKLSGFHVFSNIGDQPTAIVAPSTQTGPPVTIPYSLAHAGQVTLVIDGPDGVRVRNVAANIDQSAGANALAWNLKDEKGAYVPPGKYQWKAITHPPLELRYEMTAYPNVTSYFPDRVAWLTGPNGTGGWLADHSAPQAVAVTGDRVFLGSPVAESGVSLIETDLDGRKVWGRQSFEAFTGVGMLATDGKTLFNAIGAANFAKAGMEKNTEAVWGIDLATRETRTVSMLQPTAARKRGIQGMAARDNKVYFAIRSVDDWLNNAVAAVDVDPLASLPAYPTARPPRMPHETVADQRTDFLRLLRLKDTPPGQNSLGLTWLESTKNPDRQQHIMVAFKKPVAIGSLVFPPPPKEDKMQFQVSVLRPGAPYPPRPQEKDDWEVVPLKDPSAWAVLTLPAGTTTRALLLTFTRGGAGAADDLLAEVEGKKDMPSLDSVDTPKSKKSGLGGDEDELWQRRIEGLKLLSRRFENLFSTATVRVNSGQVSPDGSWDAQRNQPLSTAEPAIYALEWKQPQSMRGLAIKEIDGAVTEVDVFTGPAGVRVDIAATEGWENVATYNQPLRNYYQPDDFHNSRARYMDGYVDFGREVSTRAVRLRVVKQWDTKAHHPSGVRFDQGGETLDLKRCHVYGIAPLKYLGGEKEVDPLVTERLEVLDATSGKIVKDVPLPKAGGNIGRAARGNILAFNPAGDLFAISNEQLVRVDLEGGNHTVLAGDLVLPTALACDASGNLYVFDAAKDRKNIRVYAPDGKFIRVIGEPGGYQIGPWNQNRMEEVSALAVDSRGQVWAVDKHYWPKRISLWSKEGTFLKEFLGPTEYGGAGALDPADPSRLFYGPLEFQLDWTTGKTRLKNLTSLGGSEVGDRPVRVNNRLYLTNVRPNGGGSESCGLVYLYENNRVRIVAAIGLASQCKQLLDPSLVKAFGGKVLTDYICAWSDLNGDGQAQPNEVQLWPKPVEKRPAVLFDSQLGAQIGSIGFRIKEWLPNGVPVYERVDSPKIWDGQTLRLDNGNYYHVEDGTHDDNIAVQRPDGSLLWTYRTEGAGVHALTRSRPIYAGQIVCELGLAGHTMAHAGDLGEFMVFNTNTGLFNIMTSDGLFAGQIFSDIRDRLARPWSSPDITRGKSIDGCTLGQEHFNGCFVRTADNRYYAVAGHNHASVVQIIGMDRFKRFGGEITVRPDDLKATQDWERASEIQKVYARAPVIDAYRMPAPPKLDGQLNDWPFVSAEIDAKARFRIGYDDTYLYLAYEIEGRGPLKNQGQQWDQLFKSGAAVDLQIATDPNAASDRRAPVSGDQRLILTFMGDEPTAVLYQAVVPGTPLDKTWQVVSPVGSATFDRVVKLAKPRLFAGGDSERYVVEAAIPLSELGLKITPGLRLKMDWGMLESGPDGTEVLQREYWANKFTFITADAPSEAELHPNLWGHIRFHAETANAHLDPTIAKPDDTLNDVLNDLK